MEGFAAPPPQFIAMAPHDMFLVKTVKEKPVTLRSLILAAATAAVLAPFAVPGAQAAGPIARVNGQDISEAEISIAETEFGSVIAGLPTEARRRVIVEYLIEAHLLAEAAKKDKLDSGADFESRINYFKLRALRDLFIEKKGKEQVTEAAAKAVYQEQVGKLKPEPEVSAKHILVKTEDEAKAIVKELAGGADFGELAKAKSLDTGSGGSGGDLGYFTRNQMVKPFEDVAFALKKGETSAPVQTEFGWHIIRMDDVRERALPGFDEVKDQITASLVQTKLQEMVQGLRGTAKIEILDAEIKKVMEDEANANAPAQTKQ